MSLAYLLVSLAMDADAMYSLWNRTMKKNGGTKLNTNYHHAYAQHMKPFQSKNVTLLEIGANYGDSLFAWSMYFENAHQIWGLRYGVKSKRRCTARPDQCRKVHIYDGDQSSSHDLNGLTLTSLKVARPPSDDRGWSRTGYDIIIDDGSHVPDHMLFSFKRLFPISRYSKWRSCPE